MLISPSSVLAAHIGGCLVDKDHAFSDGSPFMGLTPEECRHALIRAIAQGNKHNCGANVLQGWTHAMCALTVSGELLADEARSVWIPMGLRDTMIAAYTTHDRCAAAIVCQSWLNTEPLARTWDRVVPASERPVLYKADLEQTQGLGLSDRLVVDCCTSFRHAFTNPCIYQAVMHHVDRFGHSIVLYTALNFFTIVTQVLSRGNALTELCVFAILCAQASGTQFLEETLKLSVAWQRTGACVDGQ